MSTASCHPWKLTAFLALNLADFLLTWQLVGRTGGQVYESNPLADWWLSTYGWAGLFAFKAAAVLLALGLFVVVCRLRPRTGGTLLACGCSVMVLVVGYSCALAGWFQLGPARDLTVEMAEAQALALRVEREADACWKYTRLMGSLSEDLISRRCTLVEAVDRLARTEKARNDRWLKTLRELHPGSTDAQCLAANLLENTVATRCRHPAEAVRLARRFDAEFQNTYGVRSPCRYFALKGIRTSRRTG